MANIFYNVEEDYLLPECFFSIHLRLVTVYPVISIQKE